jgi:protein Tex
MQNISARIAQELNIQKQQVDAAVQLIDEGATIPFIARYRKEATGALDDTQLRNLDERLRYLREMNDRYESIVQSITEQGKMTDALAAQLKAAQTKSDLEDLYLPYKQKRRTKGQIAIENGLEPLADQLFNDPDTVPESAAQAFVNADKNVADVAAALDGAKYILMERFSEDAQLLAKLKQYMWERGFVQSKIVDEKDPKADKFRDYFDFGEAIVKIPSHRALALFRGRNEGVLNISLLAQDPSIEEPGKTHPCEVLIAQHFNVQDKNRPADGWLKEVVRWTWKVKLNLHIETELLSRRREEAEKVAIDVFAMNLKDLLLAPPAGMKVTLGLDPGMRTGTKAALLDATGKLCEYVTIYPHAPQNQWEQSLKVLANLCQKYQVELIAIGNGTASRETEKLVGELQARHPELKLNRIVVSEAGASVYSASELAAKEFPDLDVTIRGAVSIARRLQDPLAELVKIDPKAIGVGQYQHDVSQVQLGRSLEAVVEDCVNAVGVDVNTASPQLLAHVSGLSSSIAQNIVEFRDQNGAFRTRDALKKVPRLGPKAFEQCAGFLRIRHGDNPLDASAVHPESYPLVEQIAQMSQLSIKALIGNRQAVNDISKDKLKSLAGEFTLNDILQELAKPGRDPRPEFTFAQFKEGIEKISDLTPGMILEGAVTNVTHFGAFVDIGVHQDGLVHISALSDKFVKDPREVVKTGDIVKVKVLEADAQRKRIALTMRLSDELPLSIHDNKKPGEDNRKPRSEPSKTKAPAPQAKSTAPSGMANALAAAFAKAKK